MVQGADARAAFKPRLEHQLARVSGKSGIAEELRYGLNHWEGLVRFLEDGRIELDTNIVERGIRPIVLNRKNALFAGHDEGAENWACVASLIETCKLNDLEPQAYIAGVLDSFRQSRLRIAHRRTHAVDMAQSSCRPSTRGLTRSFNVNLPTPWDGKTAYGRTISPNDELGVHKCSKLPVSTSRGGVVPKAQLLARRGGQ